MHWWSFIFKLPQTDERDQKEFQTALQSGTKKLKNEIAASPVLYHLYSSNYQPALSSRILHSIITQPKLLPSLNNGVLTGINKGPQKGEVQTLATPICLEVVSVCVAQQLSPVPAWILLWRSQLTVQLDLF